MGLSDAILRFADSYDRQARLYPALLAIAPAVLTVSTLYAAQATLMTSAVALLAACGMMFWLANLARDRGKTLEPELFRSWGGKPTVQLLRHSDLRIDAVTKQRYHAALSGAMQINFPTVEAETREPASADAVYESATKWLLERTRDTRRFPLLFKENISYGFRRNMLGVKPYGASIAIASLVWALAESGVAISGAISSTPGRLETMSPSQAVSLAGTALLTLMWFAGATQARVKIVAFAYAERLLAACESIEVPVKPKVRRRAKVGA